VVESRGIEGEREKEMERRVTGEEEKREGGREGGKDGKGRTYASYLG
jgi:hypothetical protein